MKLKHVRPLAAIVVWLTCGLIVVGPGVLFTLRTAGVTVANLECNAAHGSLDISGKTTRGSCWPLLKGQFDSYSAFYVSEDMEDFIAVGNIAALVMVVLLGVAALLVILDQAHTDDQRLHEAGLATGIAAAASLLALFEFTAACGESTAATRYGYGQTPSLAATPLLPLFPLLMLLIIYHWNRLSSLAGHTAGLVNYKPDVPTGPNA